MKKKDPKSFKDALGQFLKQEHLDEKFDQQQLIQSWERIMGRTVKARTTKMYFRDGTLFVELSSAALKQELNNSRQLILERIEEHLGKKVMADVRFL
ncbi:MAG: DUF721 domain-containing protein [Cytophagales bacterium]|nr:DUF721 domain-containing protein [Cytophagales bacterium]